MSLFKDNYENILASIGKERVLVAVSKTKPVSDIQALYDLGHRDFGENYVQELTDKQQQLPDDIRWHFIGHLQSNKVKYIAPFVHLIHGVDSLKLLHEIDKQAAKNQRIISCLLQVHIATEETKFGLSEVELNELINQVNLQKSTGGLPSVVIAGLMGMASFTEDREKIHQEFRHLKSMFDKAKINFVDKSISILSMGMSADYQVAIEEGSNMVRIGSLIFGAR
ncbi:MAG: YggS family pyridoxal phosphate-dependent enzyme [Bacteroidetes bacterium]|nr:MAG: YggS family pyridoxal phosphate-dependent enzyme [Bacteroidota bacterium]